MSMYASFSLNFVSESASQRRICTGRSASSITNLRQVKRGPGHGHKNRSTAARVTAACGSCKAKNSPFGVLVTKGVSAHRGKVQAWRDPELPASTLTQKGNDAVPATFSNVEELCEHIRRVPSGSKIDLGGRTLALDDEHQNKYAGEAATDDDHIYYDLELHAVSVELCNGVLELPEDMRLVLCGSELLLSNLIIRGPADPSGRRQRPMLVVSGPSSSVALSHATLDRCGVIITDRAAVQMHNCKVCDMYVDDERFYHRQPFTVVELELLRKHGHGVLVTDDATLELRDCIFSGSRDTGLRVSGGTVTAERCEFSHHNVGVGDAVAVDAGGDLHLRSCTFSRSSAGLTVAGAGSLAAAEECVFSNNTEHGVSVVDGGEVALRRCNCSSSREHGLEVSGAGSCAVVVESDFWRNEFTGVAVTDGGSARLVSCNCNESGFFGLDVSGEGSSATVEQSSFLGNRTGVLVDHGATVQLRGCTATSSKESSKGVSVCDAKSHVDAEGCSFTHNAWYGVFVGYAATARLSRCTCSGSKMGLNVKGHVVAENCTFTDQVIHGVKVVGGRANLDGCSFRGFLLPPGVSADELPDFPQSCPRSFVRVESGGRAELMRCICGDCNRKGNVGLQGDVLVAEGSGSVCYAENCTYHCHENIAVEENGGSVAHNGPASL